jgi:hypothetical protein
MSDERTWFTPTSDPNPTGVSGLIAYGKASEVTYKDRCKMHALAGEGVFMTPRSIGRIMNRHPRTVERILLQPETPTKGNRGRGRTILTPEVLADIIAYIRSDRENRLKDYEEIIHDTGIICQPQTLRRALKRVGMNRAVAVPKPFLTVESKAKRLAFCRFTSEWDILDWLRVIFYDEAAVNRGGDQRFFVTRFPAEKFQDDCLAPKFSKIPKVMIGGAISLELKGPLIVFDREMTNAKDNVNAACYVNHVVPELAQFYSEQRQEIQARMGVEGSTHPDNQPLLLQDNATIHTAAISQTALAEAGIRTVPNFPPSSPDLNPIEGVWGLLKRRINSRRPRPTTAEAVKQAVIEEWDALTVDDYEQMILSMPERVRDCLANEGGHTRW